ncbi:C-24(28) sterol reductase [Ascosphaera acerosa]|nr:C-24(28) sterol reductase [Ascosphaera acerosa]
MPSELVDQSSSTPTPPSRVESVEIDDQHSHSTRSAVKARRIRNSSVDDGDETDDGEMSDNTFQRIRAARKSATPEKEPAQEKPVVKDAEYYKWDRSGEYEFGGPWGVLSMMIGFPALMYYMWLGATYFDGHFPWPEEGQSWCDFFHYAGHLIYTGAFPTLRAWRIYWSFCIFEGFLYLYAPGITIEGRPLEHLGGKKLTYYCSAYASFYITLVCALACHFLGIFKLYTIMDEFGPLMSVASLSGVLVSFAAYWSAKWRHAEHRITGNCIYDFFMGMELNPRLFGLLDLKMFLEVRMPWFILLLVTMGAAARQWELYGYISGEVGLLLLAHYLYANACAKGEECIVPTWDMYYEKEGFMLIFWNLSGVPLSYCHCTIYLANHHPDTYRWNRAALVAFYMLYLFVYWVWDTCNSQKNRFRQKQRGGKIYNRKTFPQLPWATLDNPKIITSKRGHTLLVDGWYGYARKIHYTCDMFFATAWGLVCGFKSPFPWFYPIFFTIMIIHRAWRDNTRCAAKYKEAWVEYTKQVPYLFVPPTLLHRGVIKDTVGPAHIPFTQSPTLVSEFLTTLTDHLE